GDPVALDGDAYLAVAPARDIRVERPEMEGDGGERAGGGAGRRRVSGRQLGRDGLAARRALEAPALEQLYAVAARGQRAREHGAFRLVVALERDLGGAVDGEGGVRQPVLQCADAARQAEAQLPDGRGRQVA